MLRVITLCYEINLSGLSRFSVCDVIYAERFEIQMVKQESNADCTII